MKAKIKYALLLCFLLPAFIAQTKQFNLSNANCQLYRSNLYVFGIAAQKQTALITIYKTDMKFKLLDSVTVDAGKTQPGNFLQLFSDTLHDFLNIYIQHKDKKVTILRFNNLFERLATIENVDAARLNSISDFETELFYSKNDVYSIKTQKDTSGKQFYLNKYTLKSELKNFDYGFKWQFPFERKNINSAHIFYTDKNSVLLSVNVSDGLKTGQWILKINSANGKLIRGTKLNDKGETNTYEFGTFVLDTSKKTISILGQKFTSSQLDQKANKLSISNAPFVLMYLTEIDSAGEVLSKQDFKIPVNEPKTISKKVTSNYIFRTTNLNKDKEGVISFEGDSYKNTDNSLCYLYVNTSTYKLIPVDETLQLEKNTVGSNPLIEKYYFTTDKIDMNGKICIDSLSQFETLFYKNSNFPVKKQFKLVDNNFNWLLTRSDIKKNSIDYTILSPVNKLYQLTKADEILKSKHPSIIIISKSRFIISSQEEETKFQIRSIEW